MTNESGTGALEERRAELEALRRELGLVGMIRYLQQVSPGTGDYTAERAELVGHLTVDEICDAIEKRRAAEQAGQDPES
ncbi:MAG TPA: hypothetical protein VGX50_12855 [Longimicrobium sp.]|nr:hypothetical protein [Longimicrobium sp.]